jgi:hypothetical protein
LRVLGLLLVLICQSIQQEGIVLNKKQVTKLLLQDELLMVEAMPVSLEVSDGNIDIDYRGMRVSHPVGQPEATLTLRLYGEQSIAQAMKMHEGTFYGKFAIVRLPSEV